VIGTAGSVWAPDLYVGTLADTPYYPFAKQSDVAANGGQVGIANVNVSMHGGVAGSNIQCFIYNGDTAAHTWFDAELTVVYLPNPASLIL